MPGVTQRRCWPLLYTAFLCTILVLYAISHAIYSFPSANRGDEGTITASPHFLGSVQSYCRTGGSLPTGEKYMFYAPHSGFSNQVGELKNALLIAAILNRTLVVPPIFDHHAIVLGSCPKFRVHEPYEMRAMAWAHISELFRDGRYLSIADVLDITSVASLVKVMDFRVFSLFWCGVDILPACSGSLCRSLAVHTPTRLGTLESCGALLSKPDQVPGNCVYGVDEDCRTTIWVHKKGAANLSFDQPLSYQKETFTSSTKTQEAKETNRKRKYGPKKIKEIQETLGDGAQVSNFEVLSFGSLFSSEYKGVQLHVDIESSSDTLVKDLVESMNFFPFTPPIVDAGKLYSKKRIRKSFFCAQLRLLDGQFKNHWKQTFTTFKSQLKMVRDQQDPSQVLNVFIMTDLPRTNWSQTYLGELDEDKSYKLHTLNATDSLIEETAKRLSREDYGLRSGYFPPVNVKMDIQDSKPVKIHPDILLFIEEVICSCADLGFVGTSGSTLSANILQLRSGNICISNVQ
ncbi:hypothetical protein KP509_03G058500 [Ceratopteris richardii]|uniref:O-fucosyltransferase family protein n=1 Tax=Ceratopteris richardii TaxID=49495 RepID=A0A8T2V057_CERRI|nr:hypothetical protein KP509_03G058500 [Ceratopteris richardii]